MVNSAILAAVAASAFLSSPAAAALYLKNTPVLQVDAKNYDRLIAKSNHTSIVEFYAPWCGHCQNLKPAYEKAAKNLAGLANVAAVDCDEDANKPLCGQFGVKGFPTLKIFRPSKKPGKPTVEDYQGARSAKAIVDAVVDKIPNHVKRLTDKQLGEFLEDGGTAKAILFSEKGTTSALLRAVAIDFLGSISVAQIRNSQKEAVASFGVTKFPTLVLIPSGAKDGITYDGEMKKDDIVKFLSQAAEPNPGSAEPTEAKPKKSKASTKKAAKEAKKSAEAPPKEEPSESAAPKDDAASDDAPREEAPKDDSPPVIIEEGPPMLEMLEWAPQLEETCLQPKSATCVLALLPQKPLDNPDAPLTEEAKQVLASLGEMQVKESKRKGKSIPFYSVPDYNSAGIMLRREFGLRDHTKVEVVAINAKRNWWRHFAGTDYSVVAFADWVDAMKIGDGKKSKIPAGVIPEEPAPEEQEPIQIPVETTAEEPVVVPEPEPAQEAEPAKEEEKPKAEDKPHDEL